MKTSFLIILSFITNFLYSQNLSNYPEINELKIKETKCIDLKEKKKIVKKIAINYLEIIYNMDEWKEMESFRLIEAFEKYIYKGILIKAYKSGELMSLYRRIGVLYEDYYNEFEYEEDIEKAKEYFKKLNGKIKLYYNNKKIEEESNWLNGKRNGFYKEYYYDGNLKLEGLYKENKREGKFVKYYNIGKRKIEYEIEYDNNKKNGAVKWYFENGQLWEDSKWEDGYMVGHIIYYFEDGTPEIKCFYENGELHGMYEEWYDNGKKYCNLNYEHGDREGINKWYFDNGNLSQESYWLNDEKNGISKGYFYEGKLKYVYNRLNNNLNGNCKDYFENGKLSQESNWLEGKRNGISKWYYDIENNSLWEVSKWRNNVYDGKRTVYFENGNPKEKGQYSNDLPYGNFEYFNEDGTKRNIDEDNWVPINN